MVIRMNKIYQVIVNNTVVKEYPHKWQAVMYCYLNGYVYSGLNEWNNFKGIVCLDDRVKIEEIEYE